MNPSPSRRIRGLAAVFVAAFVLFGADVALAHNSLESSNPVDGGIVSTLPSNLSLLFANDIGTNTTSAEVVLESGGRVALAAPTRTSNPKELVYVLPAGLSGTVSVRWKLVSADGHAVTGRVALVVNLVPTAVGANTTTTTPIEGAPGPGVDTIPADAGPDGSGGSVTSATGLPTPIPWYGRWVGYVALLAWTGLVFAELVLARGTVRTHVGGIVGRWTPVAMLAATAVQAEQYMSIVKNVGLPSSLIRWPTMISTVQGGMILVRLAVAAVLVAVVRRARRNREGIAVISDNEWQKIAILTSFYVVALAWGGHSRTLSAPIIGIVADVVHTTAAGVWIGGLAMLTLAVIPTLPIEQAVAGFRAFGSHARTAVLALVATGVVQTLRIHGLDVGSLFSTRHGRVLLLKVVLVAAMLRVADINRHRVAALVTASPDSVARRMERLRRASLTEAALGVVVLAVTAALVTSAT